MIDARSLGQFLDELTLHPDRLRLLIREPESDTRRIENLVINFVKAVDDAAGVASYRGQDFHVNVVSRIEDISTHALASLGKFRWDRVWCLQIAAARTASPLQRPSS